MDEKTRMNATEREMLVRFALVNTVLRTIQEDMGKRVSQVKNGKRDIAMCRTVLEKLYANVCETVPDEQRESLAKNLRNAAYSMGVKSVNGGKRYDEYGVWISYNDYFQILTALGEKCELCLGDVQTARQCELKKALDRIGTDVEHENGCGYGWTLNHVEME